jgi:hypothetical protein
VRSGSRYCPPASPIPELILLALLVAGALPVYPYSREWPWSPSLVLIVILVVLLLANPRW